MSDMSKKIYNQEFEGSVVVTSHDRRLLREVCSASRLQSWVCTLAPVEVMAMDRVSRISLQSRRSSL